MKAWLKLESIMNRYVLPEEKMYRGETGVRMKDLISLFANLRKGGAPKRKGEPPVQFTNDKNILSGGYPSVEGGAIYCNYPVSSAVWNRWSRSPEFSKIISSTGDDQYHGQAQGGQMNKKNYGGRISFDPGKARTDYERAPSAVDKYDIMMIGDVTGDAIPNNPVVDLRSSENAMIIVKKIIWSPSIGSSEERKQRLEDLMAGKQAAPLKRRPQAELPEPSHRPDQKTSPYAPATDVSSPDRDREKGNALVTPSMAYRTGKGHDRDHVSPAWLGKKKHGQKDDDEPDTDR